MKNVLLGLVILAFAVACGSSTKQIEEKRILDSIRLADSTAIIQSQQQKIADSIFLADSIKKADSISKKVKK